MPFQLLVAEDEALIALSLVEMLEAEGFNVAHAFDGIKAYAIAQRLGEMLDCLVTDLSMPGMEGRDLIRLLRVDRPFLPVVVITGTAPAGGAEQLQHYCGGYGPITLLHKPFTCATVIGAVRTIVVNQDRGARLEGIQAAGGDAAVAESASNRPV